MLTNSQTVINLKNGKKIVQTEVCLQADLQAAEEDRIRKQALAKLSLAEKKVLGLTK